MISLLQHTLLTGIILFLIFEIVKISIRHYIEKINPTMGANEFVAMSDRIESQKKDFNLLLDYLNIKYEDIPPRRVINKIKKTK